MRATVHAPRFEQIDYYTHGLLGCLGPTRMNSFAYPVLVALIGGLIHVLNCCLARLE